MRIDLSSAIHVKSRGNGTGKVARVKYVLNTCSVFVYCLCFHVDSTAQIHMHSTSQRHVANTRSGVHWEVSNTLTTRKISACMGEDGHM